MIQDRKIALVTGANKGIGLAIVKQLSELGHQVFLGARSLQKGLEAKADLSNPSNVHVIELDVADEDSIRMAFQEIVSKYDQLDILVNNAGINYDTWQNATNADLNNVRETLETNLFGAWCMIQNFLPLMKKKGFGRIVNVSSGSGAINDMGAGTPGYSISKAALNILTIQFSQLNQEKDVLINSVCPGWVRTDMGGSMASRSPAQGAETIVWAALLPKGGPTGKFFRDKKEISF
ncbi:MAG: SDR family oxidoreductase [Schleiferiaceae bacterium]|nr:SDR family oxidoreductase [Schleiferiaceae bacterium]